MRQAFARPGLPGTTRNSTDGTGIPARLLQRRAREAFRVRSPNYKSIATSARGVEQQMRMFTSAGGSIGGGS